jgi:pantoate--beta-alanine ligase
VTPLLHSLQLVRTAREMRETSDAIRRTGRRLGFVPTMGALHEGHLSLVSQARADCEAVVASVYVNPLQFGPKEDFAAYPRDLERDARLLTGAGTSILFAPAEGEIHLPDHRTAIEVTGMQDVLCGRSRPGHFRGVCTVVAKLFQIVAPHAAYFGEKDAQQLRILRRMTLDLHFDVTVVGCPTVRAEDGLALSSRNAYLTPDERRAAPVIFRALEAAAKRARAGERSVGLLVEGVRAAIASEPLARIDYVEAVDDETLGPVEVVDRPVLLAAAVHFGRARLIDNIVIRPDSP